MAKKTKKIPDLQLQGFDDIDFNKEPDVNAAHKIISPKREEAISPAKLPKEEPVAKMVRVAKEEVLPSRETNVPHRTSAANAFRKKKIKEPISPARGTLAPENKKRASFNIEEDLHRALKEYSFFEEIDMVEYIFEQLVKPDLKDKGYYPPRRKKKR